jgi:DNA mismatch repair ATPase MutS
MRIQDSLAEGLSLFYAELLRLKQVVDLCQDSPCLFLLDEILHGTNTAERQKASHAILQKLVQTGSIGAVATHDLGLARLETDTQGLVRNVHFSDHIVDGEMAFDYQMRPGVVTSTNALALLKKIGMEINL